MAWLASEGANEISAAAAWRNGWRRNAILKLAIQWLRPVSYHHYQPNQYQLTNLCQWLMSAAIGARIQSTIINRHAAQAAAKKAAWLS
jgi:hypothetical protein